MTLVGLFGHQDGPVYQQVEPTGFIKVTTAKAYLIVTPTGEHWIPMSQCEAFGTRVIACSKWIAGQNPGKFDDLDKFSPEQARRQRTFVKKEQEDTDYNYAEKMVGSNATAQYQEDVPY